MREVEKSKKQTSKRKLLKLYKVMWSSNIFLHFLQDNDQYHIILPPPHAFTPCRHHKVHAVKRPSAYISQNSDQTNWTFLHFTSFSRKIIDIKKIYCP